MIKAKTSSQTIFYTLDTRSSTLATRVTRAVPQTGSSAPRGACNGGKITLYSNFARKWGGGGVTASEQGVTARQYSTNIYKTEKMPR